jgi:hypothetical protein
MNNLISEMGISSVPAANDPMPEVEPDVLRVALRRDPETLFSFWRKARFHPKLIEVENQYVVLLSLFGNILVFKKPCETQAQPTEPESSSRHPDTHTD